MSLLKTLVEPPFAAVTSNKLFQTVVGSDQHDVQEDVLYELLQLSHILMM